MCGIFSEGKVRNNLLKLTSKKNYVEKCFSICYFSLLHLKKKSVWEREGKNRDGWIVLPIFQCPWRMKGVYCVKASVCLETVSMETKYSFMYRLYIHKGATVQSVCDFMPNLRPPSHQIDYLGPWN